MRIARMNANFSACNLKILKRRNPFKAAAFLRVASRRTHLRFHPGFLSGWEFV